MGTHRMTAGRTGKTLRLNRLISHPTRHSLVLTCIAALAELPQQMPPAPSAP